jgi:hypothetical protein
VPKAGEVTVADEAGRRWRVECDNYRWTYFTESAANANRRLANVQCPCKGEHRVVELAPDGFAWSGDGGKTWTEV